MYDMTKTTTMDKVGRVVDGTKKLHYRAGIFQRYLGCGSGMLTFINLTDHHVQLYLQPVAGGCVPETSDRENRDDGIGITCLLEPGPDILEIDPPFRVTQVQVHMGGHTVMKVCTRPGDIFVCRDHLYEQAIAGQIQSIHIPARLVKIRAFENWKNSGKPERTQEEHEQECLRATFELQKLVYEGATMESLCKRYDVKPFARLR